MLEKSRLLCHTVTELPCFLCLTATSTWFGTFVLTWNVTLPWIIALLVGSVLILTLVAISFRKYEGMVPLVGTDSRDISSACHALDGDRKEGYLLPVRWAVVEAKENSEGRLLGYCGFTTAPDSEIYEFLEWNEQFK